jgi:hypothetical protein
LAGDEEAGARLIALAAAEAERGVEDAVFQAEAVAGVAAGHVFDGEVGVVVAVRADAVMVVDAGVEEIGGEPFLVVAVTGGAKPSWRVLRS